MPFPIIASKYNPYLYGPYVFWLPKPANENLPESGRIKLAARALMTAISRLPDAEKEKMLKFFKEEV